MKQCGLVLFLFAMGPFLLGLAESREDVLRAKSFIVVDKNGNKRAELGMFLNDVQLRMVDASNTMRVRLFVERSEEALCLFGTEEERRIQLGLKTVGRGYPTMAILDEDGAYIWSAP